MTGALAGPSCVELLAALPMGVLVLDASGRVVAANAEEARLAGRDGASDPTGAIFAELAPYTGPELRRALERALSGGGGGEVGVPSGDGSRDLLLRLSPATIDGQVVLVVVVDDHTRFKQAEEKLSTALDKAERDAIHDPLTRLFNRRHMESVLPVELARAGRLGTPLAIAVLDVDHFKSVNDRFGHPVGDRVLIDIAKRLSRMLRVGDTCGRIGGEEFCIALPHTNATKALLAAERVHRVMRALRFEDVPELRVSVSIGIASSDDLPPDEDPAASTRELFARADRALYDAKRTGRDRTVLYGSSV